MNYTTWTKPFVLPARGFVVAVGLVSLALSAETVFFPFPLAAVILGIATFWSPALSKRASTKFVAVVALGVLVLSLGRGRLSFVNDTQAIRQSSFLIALLGLFVGVYVFVAILRTGRASHSAWIAIFIWTVGAGMFAIFADPNTWIDVSALHADAGQALGAGASPYTGRTLPNEMAWFPEGSVFGGYVYPPITLYTYALTDLLLGDSRWISVIVGGGIVLASKRLSRSGISDGLAALALLSPGWPLIVQLSWTEPVSVFLLATAFLFGSLSRLRPMLIGLFIGSKQYLLLWAIPVTVSWIRRKPSALAIAGGMALLAYGAGFLYGFEGYIDSVFLFHLTTPTATIGSSISGLVRMVFRYPLSIPSWVSFGVGASIGGSLSSRTPKTDASMAMSGMVTLSFVFLLGSQAFPNYWYLVLGGVTICAIALRNEAVDGEPASDRGGQNGEVRPDDPTVA